MSPDYPLTSSKSRVRDWPPFRTPSPKIGPKGDPFPYRSTPFRAKDAAGGKDPWPMRSKLPDVGWLINSKYPKPRRSQPQPAQPAASQRFDPYQEPYYPAPVPQMMESIPYDEPYFPEPVPQVEQYPPSAPVASRRKDPYSFRPLNHDIGRFIGSTPQQPGQPKKDPYTLGKMNHDPTTFVGDYESRQRKDDEKWNMGEAASRGRRSLLGF